MLIGGRAQADLGPFQLGVNGVNLHAYDSTQLNNSIKGQLRQDQPLYRWLIVRITDDEPTDGRAGAVVQEVQLVINGRARPDLQAQVIRHRADVASQVGRILTLTGQFLPTAYNAIATFANRYYQEEEIPLYADYLYRLAHEADEDVSKATNLEGLLEVFALESPAMVRRVDGDEQLVYLFDLSKERYVQRVEVEAVLGKDYRVEWAAVYLNHVNATAAKIEDRFRSTFYRTAPRARGRVEDGSNLQRVRFKVGESTAIFTYSADLHLALPGIIVSGEYARSAVYGRYPANMEGELPTMGPRFAHRGAAYFANVIHWFGRGRVGAEYFSMNPDFTTEMETFLPRDSNHGYPYGSPHAGLSNETVIWRLVQDNEDGDRWPDYFLGPVLGRPRLKRLPELPLGTGTLDGDGIFPGQDENNDGIPDTNRNNNRIPDYEEDFLLYEVEPNEYVYGPDRNNNDEPDPREDDWDVDYPYDPDQRGIHLFGQVDLNRSWSAGGGRYAIKGLASGGRNRSTYVLLGYRSVGVARLRRLFFENHLRHVQDDIPDAFRFVGGSGVLGRRSGWDPLFYQDSYVNETYLEGHLRPWPSLNLVQKLRLRLNWQQGGRLYNGRFQRPRRLDFWTVVSRVDYTWRRGKLSVTPQFKYLFSRLQDQRVGRALVSEYRIVPILKVVYPLMSRTTLQAGLQGWGPLPYRVENRAQPHQSFEQRTTIVSVMNRSRYLGYDLHTIVGFQQREKEFDGPRAPRLPTWYTEGGSTVIVAPREWQFFVRGLVGFTEFGRPI